MNPSPLEMAIIFQEDRPRMNEANTPDFLWTLLQGEIAEAEEAKDNPEDLIFELADVIIFSANLIHTLGHNPDTVVREKVGRNVLKYPARGYINGTPYESQAKQDKQSWKKQNGDDEYFQ